MRSTISAVGKSIAGDSHADKLTRDAIELALQLAQERAGSASAFASAVSDPNSVHASVSRVGEGSPALAASLNAPEIVSGVLMRLRTYFMAKSPVQQHHLAGSNWRIKLGLANFDTIQALIATDISGPIQVEADVLSFKTTVRDFSTVFTAITLLVPLSAA